MTEREANNRFAEEVTDFKNMTNTLLLTASEDSTDSSDDQNPNLREFISQKCYFLSRLRCHHDLCRHRVEQLE